MVIPAVVRSSLRHDKSTIVSCTSGRSTAGLDHLGMRVRMGDHDNGRFRGHLNGEGGAPGANPMDAVQGAHLALEDGVILQRHIRDLQLIKY
ncbi:hypothetical protein TYRP_003858 [Tyrophagus putrescentiae]|nr:hypothetical protein TYRP_003858 [Tyrophagus putrescentiae]